MAKQNKISYCPFCGNRIYINNGICSYCGSTVNRYKLSGHKSCSNRKSTNKRILYGFHIFLSGVRHILYLLIVIMCILIVYIVVSTRNTANDDSKHAKTYSSQNSISSNIDSQKNVINDVLETPNIENKVIYKGNNVSISTNGMRRETNGWLINLFIENSSSQNLGFNAHAYAINGIMTNNNIYDMDCDVAAGKKANISLEIKDNILNDCGITEIRCIDILFWAYDNDKHFKSFDTDQIEIQTSLYNGEHDLVQGVDIYNSNGIEIKLLGNEDNSYDFCIINKTDSYFTFDFDEISFNDFTTSDTDLSLYDKMLLNDCQIILTVKASNEFININNIEEIESIEWNMTVRKKGDYFDSQKLGPIICNLNSLLGFILSKYRL